MKISEKIWSMVFGIVGSAIFVFPLIVWTCPALGPKFLHGLEFKLFAVVLVLWWFLFGIIHYKMERGGRRMFGRFTAGPIAFLDHQVYEESILTMGLLVFISITWLVAAGFLTPWIYLVWFGLLAIMFLFDKETRKYAYGTSRNYGGTAEVLVITVIIGPFNFLYARS